MPLITIILFFIFVGLLFLLNNILQNRKKLLHAKAYGQKEFDLELPQDAYIAPTVTNAHYPKFASLSNAEAFYTLVTPYLGSLSNDRRAFLFQSINDLKNELKMDKAVYQYFMSEYDRYEGLSDKEAAENWAKK